jgi:hypothetical protein
MASGDNLEIRAVGKGTGTADMVASVLKSLGVTRALQRSFPR